jgi:hypothetical protein
MFKIDVPVNGALHDGFKQQGVLFSGHAQELRQAHR